MYAYTATSAAITVNLIANMGNTSNLKRFKITRTTGFLYFYYYIKSVIINVNDKEGMLSGKIVDTDSNYGFYDC
jgi:hypothetical protein